MFSLKKNKLLLILLIIICGLAIMWGRGIIAERWRSALKQGRDFAAEKFPGASAEKDLFGTRVTEEALEGIVPVKVTKVIKKDYKDTITSFGTIKGFGEIPIKFKESGTVSEFYFKEGGTIRKDEIIVSQNQDMENIRLEYSAIEYSKNETLYKLGAITRDKLRQSELELETAELEVKKRNFYAPSDGLMGTRKASEGELVEPNDIVATFLDINKVFCEVGIIERDIGKVKVGQEVKVMLDTFPDDVFRGAVDSASPMIEGRSRTQTVRILIPNEKYRIKPGMFARAEITTFEKKDVLVVPRKALNKTETGYVVFGVVRKKEKTAGPGFEEAAAKIIPVKVGRATEQSALIIEGLFEGQEIILESPKAKEAIKDGGRIEIIGEE